MKQSRAVPGPISRYPAKKPPGHQHRATNTTTAVNPSLNLRSLMDEHLKIWTNAKLPEASLTRLREGIGSHELVFSKGATASNLVGGTSEEACKNADVAFGQPDPADVISSSKLKWIQITSAGYTRFDREDVRGALKSRGAVMTNSSSVYDEPCAEHLFAMMLAIARRLPFLVLNQEARKWDSHPHRAASNLLLGESVVIVGFGAIARRLVELLSPLKMQITAVRRTPTGKEPVRTLRVDQVDELLASAAHVVNILPASEETRLFFNADRIARIKKGAFFYNVGRGDTVDQVALRGALVSGQLAGAYLDVTTPEPLPAGDPLWSAPRCWITPHSAGGHATEFERQVEHFLGNLGRFESGKPLLDRILG
jgi:phosphoglycerate dehydrogenase-like enzyme